jgi:predicted branched-subunit amino acid permease
MSGTAFAGSAQFAAASILGSGGSVGAAIAAAVLLNGRYAPIGVSVAGVMPEPRWRRLLLAQLVIDESWALARKSNGTFDLGRLVGAGLLLYFAWLLSTAVGVFAATVMPDPKALGFDAAFPALFLALLWPQLRERRAAETAALGAAIAVITLPLTPLGVPIIAAAAACLVGACR